MMWTEDTIAGAILGCVGSFFVQGKLLDVAASLNSPFIGALLQWWPLVFIVTGLVVLLRRNSSERPGKSDPLGGGR